MNNLKWKIMFEFAVTVILKHFLFHKCKVMIKYCIELKKTNFKRNLKANSMSIVNKMDILALGRVAQQGPQNQGIGTRPHYKTTGYLWAELESVQ